uniref:F-box domain-containing protein n=1 Tax=Strigamia maritima TaxID=126957 RepID=T1J7D4_STRMM
MEEVDTLESLALQMVSHLVFNSWNVPPEQMTSDIVIKLKTVCKDFMNLPPLITLAIADEMALQFGSLSFGLAIWMLEANNQILKSFWFEYINLKDLCRFLSESTKQNVLELSVDTLFPMTFIESAVCFTNLKVLEILYDFKLNNWQVEQIISNCNKLEQIRIAGCQNVDGHAFDRVWQLPLMKDNLRSLDISHTSVSAARAVSLLEQLTELEEFYYHNISGFLRYQHRNPNFGRNVQKLQLGYMEDSDLFTLIPEEEFAAATSNFRALKEIILYIPFTCPIDVLNRICENCNNLQVFRLSFEQSLLGISDFDNSKTLYYFDYVYESICPQGRLSTYQLTELELAWVQRIDLKLIFSTFTQLKSLAFVRCTVMKNRDAVRRPLSKLYLSQMSSKAVNRILRNCTHLEDLSIFEVDFNHDFEAKRKTESRVFCVWEPRLTCGSHMQQKHRKT